MYVVSDAESRTAISIHVLFYTSYHVARQIYLCIVYVNLIVSYIFVFNLVRLDTCTSFLLYIYYVTVRILLTSGYSFRDVTEDPFTDLYRVEGLKGIYIASVYRVDSVAAVSNIGPEHLVSLITFNHGATWAPINPPTEDENGNYCFLFIHV